MTSQWEQTPHYDRYYDFTVAASAPECRNALGRKRMRDSARNAPRDYRSRSGPSLVI
jgi:hypothetical protein